MKNYIDPSLLSLLTRAYIPTKGYIYLTGLQEYEPTISLATKSNKLTTADSSDCSQFKDCYFTNSYA